MILEQYGLRPLKQLGQNFLIDESMASKITQSLDIQPDERILEVGPGLGAMTFLLLNLPIDFTSIEIDQGVVRYLTDIRDKGDYQAHWDLVHCDIFKHDWERLYPNQTFKVLSNVPYSITGPVLMQLLQARHRIKRAVLLLQDEVVQKMIAPLHSKDYNRLSVYFSLWAQVSRVAKVPRQCFYPQPKVDSAAVKVDFKLLVNAPEDQEVFPVVQTVFQQRRKTIGSSMRGMALGGHIVTDDQLAQSLEVANIEPQRRPQNMSSEDFVTLVRALQQVLT